MAQVKSTRHGSRWLDGFPPPEEVAEWFVKNARVHEGMNAADYVDGIVIISQSQKMKVTRTNAQGARVIVEEERMVHVPYMSIDARIDYFWKWMGLHPEWRGVIASVSSEQVHPNLPPGFTKFEAPGKDGKPVHYISCSQRVCVFERESLRMNEVGQMIGTPMFSPANGTKVVPLQGRWGPDPDAVMKVETSAVGRALGMLGILVLGSGVATAEDMQELQAPSSQDDAPEVKLPEEKRPAPRPFAESRKVAATHPEPEDIEKLFKRLKSQPDVLAEVESWARMRKIDLENIKSEQRRAVMRRFEQALEEVSDVPEA